MIEIDTHFKLAMSVMDNTIKSIEFGRNNIEPVDLDDYPLRTWQALPKSIFKTGIGMMQKLGECNGDVIANVLLFAGTKTEVHLHEDIIERFTVLSGELQYEFYNNGTRKKDIVEKGTKHNDETLTIKNNTWHIVFTTKEECLLYVKFIKI